MSPSESQASSRTGWLEGPGRRASLLSWILGAALAAGTGIAVLHFSEVEEIARVAGRVRPSGLLLAAVLQWATYAAQGQIWRAVAKAARFPLAAGDALRLSVAKLFVDQALPSAGISGTAALARHLEGRGMPRAAVAAGVVVNLASYFGTHVVLLLMALSSLPLAGATQRAVTIFAGAFVAGSALLVAAVLASPERLPRGLSTRLGRWSPLEGLLAFFTDADRRMARDRRLLGQAVFWQVAIVALDTATVWVLIESLGNPVRATHVFSAFMIANLFRSLGILPGGLGTFEASAVVLFGLVGVSLPVALSATLLFRGLSFWLPMIPGAWLSRRVFAAPRDRQPGSPIDAHWSLEPGALMLRLGSSAHGLTSAEADDRSRRLGPGLRLEERPVAALEVLLRQFASPLLLLLVFAAVVAAATGDLTNAAIVLTILGASAWITWRREYSAHAAAAALRDRVRARTTVLRDGAPASVLAQEVVPGDVVLLSAGTLVPADARVIDATDAHVSESVLTGESFPVAKSPGVLPADTPIRLRSNCVHLGTNVRSGSLRCLVVATGRGTQYGSIAERLSLRPPQTEFDRGVRRFGYLLTSTMLVIVLLVFAAHMLGGRPVPETLMFSIALAVGLSPELLPAIISVNVARSARMMAERGVLVRRLNAIENLGSMDVLCTDKTGTLTEGVIELEGGYDALGAPSGRVVDLAAINAALATGVTSPLDDAILAVSRPGYGTVTKLAEIPFDFVRKRASVVVEREDRIELVTKGAVDRVLDVCTALADGTQLDAAARARLSGLHAAWSRRGIRVLAVASKPLGHRDTYGRHDEQALVLAGFLTFLDRPKQGAAQALSDMSRLGVSVKLISGDTRLVAEHVAALVGMRHERVLTGAQLDELHDEALWREAERTDLFVEVDPNQKERIILSLKKMGHVVGFLGDGVNDAPAMHAADTSLSVDTAVDVARDAADFVLLRRDLDVIRQGIEEGRRTFANTLKYILTTISANLGNMASMAAASLLLPFLPLTAGQILLNNFLSDVPAVGIADDSVDPEMVEQPRRWDMKFIGRFMVEFGLLSSLFDLATFGVLLGVFQSSVETFRTGWFVESLLTELAVALVVRTRRPFFRSRPGGVLLVSTVVLAALALALPFLPVVALVGFVPLTPALLATLVAITVFYVGAAEIAKRWFYRSVR